MDPSWDLSVPIYPGMCMMRTAGEAITLINGTGVPMGLSAFYMGGDGIDEITEQGVNACAVWVLAADAEAEVLAPAFNDALSWTDPGNGVPILIGAYTSGVNRGRLCPLGTSGATTHAVAKLVRINSATKITIGGLSPADLTAV
jgi:hypothetical protein